MKKKIVKVTFCFLLLLGVSGCGSSKESSSISQAQIDKHIKENYYKASNGKWYHK